MEIGHEKKQHVFVKVQKSGCSVYRAHHLNIPHLGKGRISFNIISLLGMDTDWLQSHLFGIFSVYQENMYDARRS